MKGIMICLLVLLGAAAGAQTVSISIQGNRNLQLRVNNLVFDIDNNSLVNPSKNITINSLKPGEHVLELLRIADTHLADDRATTEDPGNLPRQRSITRFILKPGFDVAIVIATNGVVQVRDKQIAGTTSGTRMPMTAAAFSQLLDDIRFHWRNTRRITAAQTAISDNNNYFTTAQLQQVLETVTGESNRLTLARLAYPRLTDPGNFMQVYRLFETEQARNELSVFLRDQPGMQVTQSFSESFGPLNGTAGFDNLLQRLGALPNDLRTNEITSILTNETNSFSVAELRRLIELVGYESSRLHLLKLVYPQITDPVNYPLLYPLLSTDVARIELINHVKTAAENGGLANFNLNKPAMDSAGFEALVPIAMTAAREQRLEAFLTETFSNPGNYFTARQALRLITLVEGELPRLGLSKLAYRSVVDPREFLEQAANLLVSLPAKNELTIHAYSYRPAS